MFILYTSIACFLYRSINDFVYLSAILCSFKKNGGGINVINRAQGPFPLS